MIDRKPRLIVRARRAGRRRGVRSRARRDFRSRSRAAATVSTATHTCDDGIMLDLSPMKTITVDPNARTVDRGGRGQLGRLRRGDAGARASHDRRPSDDDRHRRADARDGQRLARAALRLHGRQSHLGRRRHRGRTTRPRERRRERRPLLGAPGAAALRRRRELRVPAARGRAASSAGCCSGRRAAARSAVLPRFHRGRARPVGGAMAILPRRRAVRPAGAPGSTLSASSHRLRQIPSAARRSCARSASSAPRSSTSLGRCRTTAVQQLSTPASRRGSTTTGKPSSSTS